jgi:K+-sensing histidine kinase KdpD
MQNSPPQSSKSKILQSLAHEARNQLSIIIGCADMLLNDRQNMTDEMINSLVKEIQHASGQLQQAIQEMSQSRDKVD